MPWLSVLATGLVVGIGIYIYRDWQYTISPKRRARVRRILEG